MTSSPHPSPRNSKLGHWHGSGHGGKQPIELQSSQTYYHIMLKDQVMLAEAPVGGRSLSKSNLHRPILVVDDKPLIRMLYIKVLVNAGYHADGAENGAVAWDALQLTDYELLITDNLMPKLSGVDLLKRIYASRMTLPIIMVTGTFPEEEFKDSPWIQPEILLLKPHTVQELLAAVEEVLRANNAD